MNSRASVGQNQRNNQGNSDPSVKHKKGAPNHLQKCWQPKQKKVQLNHQRQAALLSPAEQEAMLRQHALAEARHGNYVKAIAIFNDLIELNPNNANHYSNRGLVYFQSGQSAAAIADYDYAITLNPRLDSAYNNRANYYAAQGKFLEAILDYDIALDLNPTNVRAWINQGITFRDLEMYDRALDSFELALVLGQLEEHVYAERGRTYHLRGDWNCAVGDYRRAMSKITQPESTLENSTLRLYLQVESWLEDLLSPLHTR